SRAGTGSATSLSAPTNLAAEVGQGISRPTVALTWNAGNGATSYFLDESQNGIDWTLVDSGIIATNYLIDSDDFFLPDNCNYFYRVRATNGVQTSGPSNVAVAALV